MVAIHIAPQIPKIELPGKLAAVVLLGGNNLAFRICQPKLVGVQVDESGASVKIGGSDIGTNDNARETAISAWLMSCRTYIFPEWSAQMA